MTCIVGVVEKDHVVLGGDAAATGGNSISLITDPKVFKIGSWIFGGAGSLRFIQVMKYNFEQPKIGNKDVLRYLCSDFVSEVLKICETSGINKTENGKFGGMLIGYKNRLFELDDDLQILENINGLSAIGSGADLALGSLHSTTGPAHDRCLTALEAAATYNTTVSKPFTIIST